MDCVYSVIGDLLVVVCSTTYGKNLIDKLMVVLAFTLD